MAGVNIFNSAVKQLQSSQKNIEAITQARQKLEREKELFDLKKKQAEINLKESEMSGQLTQFQLDQQKELQKAYEKQQKGIFNAQNTLLSATEQKQADTSLSAMALAKNVYKQSPEVQTYVKTLADQALTPPIAPQQSQSVFDTPVKPVVERGSKGLFQQKDLSQKEYYMDLINKKRARGEQLKPVEQEFFNKNVGIESKSDYSRKDVVDLARKLANDSGLSIKSYLKEAEDLLSGNIDISESSNPNLVNKSITAGMKAGNGSTIPMIHPETGKIVQMPKKMAQQAKDEDGFEYAE